MNHELIIKTTNRVGLYVCAALFYWIFIFLTITVFDLRIFRERITEMFFFSLLGILALLGGALMLNLMSNLSRISAALASREAALAAVPTRRRGFWWVLVSVPLLAAALFAGDALSSRLKKDRLVAAAERLIAENPAALAALADYRFTPEFRDTAERKLRILNKIDKHFPEVRLLVPDRIEDRALVLSFDARCCHNARDADDKASHIFSTNSAERDYLHGVFANKLAEPRFSSDSSGYQLYMPTRVQGRLVLLYLSDYQRYGKL